MGVLILRIYYTRQRHVECISKHIRCRYSTKWFVIQKYICVCVVYVLHSNKIIIKKKPLTILFWFKLFHYNNFTFLKTKKKFSVFWEKFCGYMKDNPQWHKTLLILRTTVKVNKLLFERNNKKKNKTFTMFFVTLSSQLS